MSDGTNDWSAALARVHNRREIPLDFLEDLVNWVNIAPEEIFTDGYRGKETDIYDLFTEERPDLSSDDLGDIAYRKALICETFRVLGGYESSWNWDQSRHHANKTEVDDYKASAGIFQVAPNSTYFDKSLKECFWRFYDGSDKSTFSKKYSKEFRDLMKQNREFAFEYTTRLIRFTIRHHGPLVRREIFSWMSEQSINEFLNNIL